MRRCLLFFIVAFTIICSGGKSFGQCPPTITITALFTTTVISGDTVEFCAGDSCKLSASPSSGVSYQWYQNGLQIPNATNSFYYPTEGGNYYLIISGCSIPSDTIHAISRPLPTGSISAYPEPPVCYGEWIILTLNADTTLYYWNWNVPFVELNPAPAG